MAVSRMFSCTEGGKSVRQVSQELKHTLARRAAVALSYNISLPTRVDSPSLALPSPFPKVFRSMVGMMTMAVVDYANRIGERVV